MLLRFALSLAAPVLIAQATHPDVPHFQKGFAVLTELVGQWDRAMVAEIPLPATPARLSKYVEEKYGAVPNPWDPSLKAYRTQVLLLEGFKSHGDMMEAMKPLGHVVGQTVYALQLPKDKAAGYLAAVYRPMTPVGGNDVIVKAVAIE